MAGLEPETQRRYLNSARGYLVWFIVEKGSLRPECLQVESILFWMLDVFEAGFGAGTVRHALAGLEVFSILLGVYSRWTKHPVISLALGRWDREGKKHKTNRHYISRQQAIFLLKKPPPGVDTMCWQIFLAVSWIFALRHSEMRSAQPCDFQYIENYGKEGKTFSCFVRNPKTAKGQNQTVYVPLSTIPKQLAKILVAFMRSNHRVHWEWNVIVPRVLVNPALRAGLKLSPPEALVHHSLRHGRACDLYHNCGYKILGDLMQIGRWRSKGAVLCYVHAKVNWEAPTEELDIPGSGDL